MTLPSITIVGNLVADPELSFTPSGAARCSFRVAATDRRKDPTTGEWADGDSTFINVTAWRAAAEIAADKLSKGSGVVVIGKLKSRQVENGDKKVTYYEIDAETIALDLRRIDSGSKSSKATAPEQDPWATKPSFDTAPF